jgi:hypothetical protein
MFRPVPELLLDTRRALHVSGNGLAALVGVSRRTGQRWNQGRGPYTLDLRKIAELVFPVDAELAAELAEAAGATLESLGLVPATPVAPVAPATPVAPTAPMAAPAPRPTPPDRVVDAVVCAAAEAMQVMPQSVRPALLAAFACARELGLSVQDVERVLRATPRA